MTRWARTAACLIASSLFCIPLASAQQTPQRVIVKWDISVTEADPAVDELLTGLNNTFDITLTEYQVLGPNEFSYELQTPAGELMLDEIQDIADFIEASDLTVYASPVRRRLLNAYSPSDTLYSSQWHYFEQAAGVNLPEAWDIANGSGVVVAVIDSGLTDHHDLNGNVVGGYDFITDTYSSEDGDGPDSNARDEGSSGTPCTQDDDNRNPPPDDRLPQVEDLLPTEISATLASDSIWHGTHVAGIIAALSNSTGVLGVAYRSKIVNARAFGRCLGGADDDIIKAIRWSAGISQSGVPHNPNPADVINMSFSGADPAGCPSAYSNVFSELRQLPGGGPVLVASAGNDGAAADGFAPANCEGVITVASVNRQGGQAETTNTSPNVVDLAAPGGNMLPEEDRIFSTYHSSTDKPNGSATYGYLSGTSFSAPHVSGIAALLLDQTPSLTPTQVRDRMMETARPFPIACAGCGAGIVDATAALTYSGSQPGTVQFKESTQLIRELDTDRGISIEVRRLGGATGSASVDYSVDPTSGTATPMVDYTIVNGTLEWADGDSSSKFIQGTIRGDDETEENETIILTLSNAQGASLGSPDETTITIQDDDGDVECGEVNFSPTSYTFSEGAGTVTLTAVRSNGSDGTASVGYSVTGGSASQGTDFTVSGNFQWADGEDGADSISMVITDDSSVEGNETVSIELTSPVGVSLGANDTASVTITDNDAAVPSTPSNFTWTHMYCNGAHRFSWGTSSGSDYYQLARRTSTSSTYYVRYQGSNPFYFETLENAPTQYYYKVRACNSSGCSAYSQSEGPVAYYNGCQ